MPAVLSPKTSFAAMQRRYQSTMMGLIAIEQLTRPVVAGQALLTSAASSQAGASAGDAAVDKAQTQVTTVGDAALTAKSELDKAIARDDKAQRDAQSLRSNIAAEKAKKPVDDATVTSLTDKVPAADREVSDARLALLDARRRDQNAELQVKRAEVALRDAQAKVTASTLAGGALGAVAQATSETTKFLTRGVYDIVVEINRSYTKDACITLMVELARSSSSRAARAAATDGISKSLEAGLEVCQQVLQTAAMPAKAAIVTPEVGARPRVITVPDPLNLLSPTPR
jgi:hypothetical protein